ncbi:recombinase family protein [Streptomyces sp. SID13666]|uniref:recombinase family protein n=1 Tax=Streptomyces sp. SID13666 TaxID=2706054 RepID=UPI0013C20F1A|nr:recombinase family protein [Streptomyces sp. SID13666]NEA54447.1 recombinase family protein [Streptomyces sp. SID13666]
MERSDLPTLRAMGFKDDELQRLGLWEAPSGTPAELAEMYVRRSKKKDTLSTLRQQVREMLGYATAEGKRVRHIWFEQRSASKAHVRREEFDSATGAVISGLSKTLYVYKTSRLSRRGMGQVGPLLDLFDQRRARIVMTVEKIDSSKGSRMVLAILSEQAREQAAEIAHWTKVGGDAHKAEGRWPGGVTPYGLECPKGTGKLRAKPSEYKYARPLIAERLLKMVTPAEIAEDLNRRNIPTRKGKKWRAQTVIQLAQSPSWAGLIPNRERQVDDFGSPIDKWHRAGEPLIGPNGHPVQAGEGVVTFAEWEKIRAIISGRSRPGTSIGDRTRGVRKAVTIMTGTLRCPHCKGLMGNGGRNYRCLARINQGPSVCKGVATMRGRVDDAMAMLWANHILSLPPESATIMAIAQRWLSYQDPAKEARKQAVSAALDNAVSRELKLNKEFFLGGGMDETQFETLRGDLAAQITGLKTEIARLGKAPDLTPLMSGEALSILWDGAGIDGRRALIQAALKSVTVLPAKARGDKTPIAARLVPEWRDKSDARNIHAALSYVEKCRKRKQDGEAA